MVPCHGFHINISGYLYYLKIKTFPHPSNKVKKIKPGITKTISAELCVL